MASRSRDRARRAVAARRWLGLALVCTLAGSHAQEVDRIRTLALAGSVLKVEAMNARGGYALGTAVSVAAGRFVTNCHVTRDAQSIALVQAGARWRAEAERADLDLDLCLLKVPGLGDVPPVPVSSARDLQSGDPVVAVGYTGGAGLLMHAGRVNALHVLHGSKVIQTTTAFTSGASGGALFDAAGRLVGILTFRLRGTDGYYFAAPVDWIEGTVDDDAGYADVRPLRGPPPFWAKPVDALPFFMQAASLEVDGRWSDLLALTDRWTRESASDPEPWFMRGNSLAKLDDVDRAVESLRRAVTLDPRFARAWFDLGQAYVRQGAFDDARQVARVLDGLDATLADELSAMLTSRPH